jgi:ribonucleotide monophosphatase NagD (HAD superfamily)
MYGDNRANEKKINLTDVKSMASQLDMDIWMVLKGNVQKEDILQLAQKSQEITDALNALYEQMKG